MFSQDDDSQQRVALLLVFGLVALVIATVIGFGIDRASAKVPVAAPSALLEAESDSMDAAQASAQAFADGASVQVEQGVVKFYFESGNAELAVGAAEVLADLVEGAKLGRKLVISGFHDATGGGAQNAVLATQRALVVRDALRAAGVPEAQIELKKPKQVSDSGNDAQARRVEISLE
ncbi:MAG: OmpA family protein [Polaromonas sp.]|nr:OmpA family protein [Polaromonas sp.]